MAWRWKSRDGTLIRHPVDFYPERCAWGYGSTPAGGAQDSAFVELWNNSNPPVHFKVYQVTTGAIQNQYSYLIPSPNPVGSPNLLNANHFITPLIVNGPTPPGLILNGTITQGISPAPAIEPILTTLNWFGGVFPANHPIAIIPPGYSLISYGFQSLGGEGEAAFLYMWD
jgi:hypothetical protein